MRMGEMGDRVAKIDDLLGRAAAGQVTPGESAGARELSQSAVAVRAQKR
jgi:hypothetical protein